MVATLIHIVSTVLSIIGAVIVIIVITDRSILLVRGIIKLVRFCFYKLVRFIHWLPTQSRRISSAISKWKLERRNKKQRQITISQANNLIQQAKAAIALDTYNPFDFELLAQAIDYYQQSNLLVKHHNCIQSIEDIQIEIDRRKQFKLIFSKAEDIANQKYFKTALTYLQSAQELYSPPELVQKITAYQKQIPSEETYLTSLATAKDLSYLGKLPDALNIISRAVAKFTREDGETLQVKLNRVIAAKKQFEHGKVEEKLGNTSIAKEYYAGALSLVPDWKLPQLRLAIIGSQSGEIDRAIEQLIDINLPHAQCLRGLLYTKQKDYSKATEVWETVDRDLVIEYLQIVANIALERQRLVQPQIQSLVIDGELEQARNLSLEFINQYGSNLLIETNLIGCIIPGIEAKIWATKDWGKIATYARETWLNQRDIKSLHNWAIALYYSTQLDDNIEELIVAWATAIVNIQIDSAIQDLPWMGTKSPSMKQISIKLWEILEQPIEKIKAIYLPRYLDLRDRYRQELWAMKLAQIQTSSSIKIGELIILPSLYQRDYAHIPLGNKSEIWQTLYTDWGKVVAACLAGDPERAEIIKVNLPTNSDVEKFANNYVLYQQGCYYLEQQDWYKASYYLNLAGAAIQENKEWYDKIDELCDNYQHQISDIDENLEFARFWDDLLSSSSSEIYQVEYLAIKIDHNWRNSLISDEKCLEQIRSLAEGYPYLDVVQEIFNMIEAHWLKSNS